MDDEADIIRDIFGSDSEDETIHKQYSFLSTNDVSENRELDIGEIRSKRQPLEGTLQ